MNVLQRRNVITLNVGHKLFIYGLMYRAKDFCLPKTQSVEKNILLNHIYGNLFPGQRTKIEKETQPSKKVSVLSNTPSHPHTEKKR